MIGCAELGRFLAHWRSKSDAEGVWQGIGIVDGAIFGLLGLLAAFTFTGAASRFDARRIMIIDESNAIGTAYLRLDLLPAEYQNRVRIKFREYLDTRIRIYQRSPEDNAGIESDLAIGSKLQAEIWSQSVLASNERQPVAIVLLPALNQMFDIANSRALVTQIHPPPIIFAMLFVIALTSAICAGYSMAKSRTRDWVHTGGFAIVTAITFYVIIDLEYPRLGAIRVNAFDEAFQTLRAGMN